MICPRCGCNNSDSTNKCIVCEMPLSYGAGQSNGNVQGNGYFSAAPDLGGTPSGAADMSYNANPYKKDTASTGREYVYPEGSEETTALNTSYPSAPVPVPPKPYNYDGMAQGNSTYSGKSGIPASPVNNTYPEQKGMAAPPAYSEYASIGYSAGGYGHKKKSGKRIIIVGIICAALAAIVTGLWLFVFSGKAKAKRATKEYFATLESCNSEKVINASVPDEIVDYLMEVDGMSPSDKDELMDDADQELKDIYEINSVSFLDVEIGDVEKVSLKEYVDDTIDGDLRELLDEMLSDYTIEYDGERMTSVDDAYNWAEDKLVEYGVDTDHLYLVDVDYEMSIDSSDSEVYIMGMVIPELIDKLLVYRADGEYYVLPDFGEMFIIGIAPLLESYIYDSIESSDISNADLIAKAITTALADEAGFNDAYFQADSTGTLIFEFSEDGLRDIGPDFASIVMETVWDIDSLRQKTDGYENQYLWVRLKPGRNECEVFREEELIHRLYPDQYDYYNDYDYDYDYYGYYYND